MGWRNDNFLAQASLFRDLKWTTSAVRWEQGQNGELRVWAPSNTDYFVDPGGTYRATSAPVLYAERDGDFAAIAHVRPRFAATYDAAGLMVVVDDDHWIKLCFERTDLGCSAIVTVVTHGTSDDANGCELEVDSVWLQVARRGDVYALHYSLDGQAWRMVRYLALGLGDRVRVGLTAQSPRGEELEAEFFHFSIGPNDIVDARSGV